LLAALKIVQRGDLGLRDMIGGLCPPRSGRRNFCVVYINYGVDFDGDGHVDLRHSVPMCCLDRELASHQRLQDGRAVWARALRIRGNAPSGTGP